MENGKWGWVEEQGRDTRGAAMAMAAAAAAALVWMAAIVVHGCCISPWSTLNFYSATNW